MYKVQIIKTVIRNTMKARYPLLLEIMINEIHNSNEEKPIPVVKEKYINAIKPNILDSLENFGVFSQDTIMRWAMYSGFRYGSSYELFKMFSNCLVIQTVSMSNLARHKELSSKEIKDKRKWDKFEDILTFTAYNELTKANRI